MIRNRVKNNKKEITFNRNGNPSGVKVTTYKSNNTVATVSYLSIRQFANNQARKKEYGQNPGSFFRSNFPQQLPNNTKTVVGINNVLNYKVTSPKYNINSPHYNAASPNYPKYNNAISPKYPSYQAPVVRTQTASPNNITKYTPQNYIKNRNGCQPSEFLYRSFKPQNGKSYFNYIMSNNKNGFANVSAVPKNIQKGIVKVGSGGEGVVFVGCIDESCDNKVSVKVGTAMQSAPGEKNPRNWNTSPGVQEFKITKDIWNKCHEKSPHIIMPYAQFTCTPQEAFVGWNHPGLRRAVQNTTGDGTIKRIENTERLIVSYYEFYNGGSLFDWLDRHSSSVTEKDCRAILFQIIYTLKVIYETVPSFRHNDIHLENILVKTANIPKTGTTKYGKFEIPNNGIFTALGDFGWGHSNNNPNPRVMSGMWAAQGIRPNKSVRMDLHFFLTSALLNKVMGRFKYTREFLKNAIGGQDLMSKNVKNKLVDFRLIVNNKRVADIDVLLNSEYFKSFNPSFAPPTVSLVKRIGNILLPPVVTETMNKGSLDCGTTAKKSAGGARAMSVDAMIKFIKEYGTDAAKAMLKSFRGKKPKRVQACFILKSFSKGKVRMGQKEGKTPSPNKPRLAPLAPPDTKQRAPNMTTRQLKNFIARKGTINAKEKMNAIKANSTPLRSKLIRIMKTFNAGRKKAVVSPSKRPIKKPVALLKLPAGKANNTTRRTVPVRKAINLSKSDKITPAQRKTIQLMANRLENKAFSSPSKSPGDHRDKLFKKAAKIFRRARRRGVKAGLFNEKNSLRNQMNVMVSPRKKVPTRAQSVKFVSPRTGARVALSPKPRPVSARLNMKDYRLGQTGALKINGVACSGMTRPQIDKLLIRVKIDPKTVPSIKKACILIQAARLRYVKPYKTKAQNNQNTKDWRKQLEVNYDKRLNNIGKRSENARNQKRRANTKKINNNSEGVPVRRSPQAQGARLRLFNKLGL